MERVLGLIRALEAGGGAAVEADWSAKVRMDLRYWDRGETIRARTSSVFEVADGKS